MRNRGHRCPHASTTVPADYIVRLRAEQAALRKATLRLYHIQREAFLPSAKR